MYLITMTPPGVRPTYFAEWLDVDDTIAGSNRHRSRAQRFGSVAEARETIGRMHPAQQSVARIEEA